MPEQLSVTLSGPFFTRDPGKTLYQNIGSMLDELVEELETSVSAGIASHASEMPYYTGWTTEHVEGYRTGRTGKHWAVWGAVGLPTTGMGRADAIRTKAAGATIERRWHPFRKAKGDVYRARALISANLSKGME